ncbi:MAG: hypothetical protein LBN22_11580, partial [Clostridiales Family XIII bacterium]|jgi:hypothetical protein|nr:hypothetical protein [Clostridiales Family XIII bacterium]
MMTGLTNKIEAVATAKHEIITSVKIEHALSTEEIQMVTKVLESLYDVAFHRGEEFNILHEDLAKEKEKCKRLIERQQSERLGYLRDIEDLKIRLSEK